MAIKLLLKEIKDRYIQENFQRIAKEIESLDSGVAGSISNVVNITATQVWNKFDDSVSALSTKTIDSLSSTKMLQAKYVITIYNVNEDKFKSFEMTVSRKEGTVGDTVFNKIGDSIDYGINAIEVGPVVQLQVQNNELFNLNVSIGRLSLNTE